MQYQCSSLFLFDYQMKRGGFVNIPYVFRKCTKCGEWLVTSTVNFHKNKGCKYGFMNICKECRREKRKLQDKEYREKNKEEIKKREKEWRKTNYIRYKEIHKKSNDKYRENNREKIKETRKEKYYINLEKSRENSRERAKKYYKNNSEKVKENKKNYIKNNPEKYRESQRKTHKKWKENNPEKVFNAHNKRRINEEKGNGINKMQWLEMMQYFNFEDAYSGEPLNIQTRSIDHIIPLNKNGVNEIYNCVPMTRTNNSSKHDKDMEEWYQEQDFYSEDRLQKIYEWQEYAFNKWGDINVTRTIKGNIK